LEAAPGHELEPERKIVDESCQSWKVSIVGRLGSFDPLAQLSAPQEPTMILTADCQQDRQP